MSTENKIHKFKVKLQKLQSWTIAPLPKNFKIQAVHAFGRTPIIATTNKNTWSTSLWTEKSGITMIAIPKKVRAGIEAPSFIDISFVYDYDRFG